MVPVCGTFGAGTPVKKSQKVTFMSKKSQNVMLYIKYKRKAREKNLKKSLGSSMGSSCCIFAAYDPTYVTMCYIVEAVGWEPVAV